MKKLLTLSTLALCVCWPVAGAHAQQRKSADVYAEVRAAMDEYDFETAESLLEEDIARLKKRRKPTDEADSLLAEVQRYMSKLEATERVVFIDSVVVDKAQLLSRIPLSGESGSLHAYSTYFQRPDTMGCVVFKNQLGNHLVFAQPEKGGGAMLYQSEMVGTEWSPATRLSGLFDEEVPPRSMGYPFMLTDGVTLYYAAIDAEGLGGYDIYMTRYDAGDQTFLMPENIGMPFNSPANDYMYAVDEFNNLGWFATDRNQPEGKVCIYTFIPNATRRLYNTEEMDGRELGRRARIASIRDTWTDKQEMERAKAALSALYSVDGVAQKKGDFEFVVNDALTCTAEDDFKNAEARGQVKFWLECSKMLKENTDQLARLRDEYATSDDAKRQQLAPQIRILEGKQGKLIQDKLSIEKKIRQLETGL